MKILLVAATQLEIQPVLTHFNIQNEKVTINRLNIFVLVTGVGMVATAYTLGAILAKQNFDLIINIGIAGSFDRSLKIAEVVNVSLDCFAELGAEDGEAFISIDELGFSKSGIKPKQSIENPILTSLTKARSITVNKVHGNDESIYATVARLNPQTESMEGAAFFYACNETNTPCVQLRGISNYIERRNRENWNVPLAIKNVNTILIELLNHLA